MSSSEKKIENQNRNITDDEDVQLHVGAPSSYLCSLIHSEQVTVALKAAGSATD